MPTGEQGARAAKPDIFGLIGLDPIEVFNDLPQETPPTNDPIALYDHYLKTSGLKLITKKRHHTMKIKFTDGITGVHHDYALEEATKDFNAAYDEELRIFKNQPFIYCFEAVCRKAGREQIRNLFKDGVDDMVALLIDNITPGHLVRNAFTDPVYAYLHQVLHDIAPEILIAKTLGAHLDIIKKNATTSSGGANRYAFDVQNTSIYSLRTKFSCAYLTAYLMQNKNAVIARRIKDELTKKDASHLFWSKKRSRQPLWDVMAGTPLRQIVEATFHDSFISRNYKAVFKNLMHLPSSEANPKQQQQRRRTRNLGEFD